MTLKQLKTASFGYVFPYDFITEPPNSHVIAIPCLSNITWAKIKDKCKRAS